MLAQGAVPTNLQVAPPELFVAGHPAAQPIESAPRRANIQQTLVVRRAEGVLLTVVAPAPLALAASRPPIRRVLVEAAWSYRHPARVSEPLRARLEGLPKAVRDIAWKAQIRLCGRYRRLGATGKKLPVVIAAVAREMAAFLWAIGRQVAPAA